jgi:hypothetical protein
MTVDKVQREYSLHVTHSSSEAGNRRYAMKCIRRWIPRKAAFRVEKIKP